MVRMNIYVAVLLEKESSVGVLNRADYSSKIHQHADLI